MAREGGKRRLVGKPATVGFCTSATTTNASRHSGTLPTSVVRQLSVSCAHVSCSSVAPPSVVPQPDEMVLKVDVEERVRRWLTCGYNVLLRKRRENELPVEIVSLRLTICSLCVVRYIRPHLPS